MNKRDGSLLIYPDVRDDTEATNPIIFTNLSSRKYAAIKMLQTDAIPKCPAVVPLRRSDAIRFYGMIGREQFRNFVALATGGASNLLFRAESD